MPDELSAVSLQLSAFGFGFSRLRGGLTSAIPPDYRNPELTEQVAEMKQMHFSNVVNSVADG